MLVKSNFIDTTSANVTNVTPAFVEGKMYSNYNRTPIGIRLDDGKRRKAPHIMYGAVIEFEAPVNVWEKLDVYHSCSRAFIGQKAPYDLFIREEVVARPIHFDSMEDFLNLKFERGDEDIECYCYFGNTESELIQKYIRFDRSGVVWRTFFNIEHWEEYK